MISVTTPTVENGVIVEYKGYCHRSGGQRREFY